MTDRSMIKSKARIVSFALAVAYACFPRAVLAESVSLDDYVSDIAIEGGLSKLCLKKPAIDVCRFAVGEWKPIELERIKAITPFCFETCGYDIFSFVKKSTDEKEYPVVVTKDFDSSAPSRGTEIRLLPVAIELTRYEGCAGCPLIRSYPLAAKVISNASEIRLINLGRGIFYLPSAFRRRALNGSLESNVRVVYKLKNQEYEAIISSEAMQEYANMIRALRYDKIP